MYIQDVRAVGNAQLAVRAGFLFMDDIAVVATLGTVQVSLNCKNHSREH